jgi:hypothetical protein
MVHLCYLYLLKCIVVQRDFYQLVFVSFNSNTTGVTCGEGTLPEHPSSTPVLVRFILLDLGSCMLLYLFTYTVAQHDFHQMMFVSFNSNTAAVMWDRTDNHSGAHEFTPSLSAVLVARSVDFCVEFCRSLFVLCLLAIVFSVLLRFTVSDNLFDIFSH